MFLLRLSDSLALSEGQHGRLDQGFPKTILPEVWLRSLYVGPSVLKTTANGE